MNERERYASEHIRTAELLLGQAGRKFEEMGWDTPGAKNMLLAAMVHLELAKSGGPQDGKEWSA